MKSNKIESSLLHHLIVFEKKKKTIRLFSQNIHRFKFKILKCHTRKQRGIISYIIIRWFRNQLLYEKGFYAGKIINVVYLPY